MSARAAEWPSEAVPDGVRHRVDRPVVPVPPGGSNDVLSRITAQAMSPGLGQQVVIDNRAGAAGMINDLVVGDAHVAVLNAASAAAMINKVESAHLRKSGSSNPSNA